MKASRTPSPSTLHQRAYRERMRQAGLVKKDVWIRPEHARALAEIEKNLRHADACLPLTEGEAMRGWQLADLHGALLQSPAVTSGLITPEWVEAQPPGLHLVMHEYGDLSLFVAKSGSQIVVEAWLWPLAAVADPAAFNAHVLATHKLLPLSGVAIEAIGGVPGYILFGALDADSGLASLMLEIDTLADNTIAVSEAWQGYLRPEYLAEVGA